MAKIQFDTQFKTPYITSYGEKQQKKNKNEFENHKIMSDYCSP